MPDILPQTSSTSMADDTDDWLDAALLADDPPSARNWRTKARGGISRPAAMAKVPTDAQFAFRIQITAHRALRRYLRDRGENPAAFFRKAIETELRSRGHWNDHDYRDLHGR
jgi:hypothetical protein